MKLQLSIKTLGRLFYLEEQLIVIEAIHKTGTVFIYHS